MAMLSKDVFKHFDGNQAAVGRALGITRKAVNKWGRLVPPTQAYRLHQMTEGRLLYDPADYEGRYPTHVFIPPSVSAP